MVSFFLTSILKKDKGAVTSHRNNGQRSFFFMRVLSGMFRFKMGRYSHVVRANWGRLLPCELKPIGEGMFINIFVISSHSCQ